MVHIIETNLLVYNGYIMDHQNRIIEANSWNEYIDYYVNHTAGFVTKEFKSLTEMVGNTLPSYVDIYNFKYDNFHLSCSWYSPDGVETKKLAYLVNIHGFDKDLEDDGR